MNPFKIKTLKKWDKTLQRASNEDRCKNIVRNPGWKAWGRAQTAIVIVCLPCRYDTER